MIEETEKGKLLLDVKYEHPYASRDRDRKHQKVYEMHPQRNISGDGSGLFSIRKADKTKPVEYVTEAELAELFAVDGFSKLGINLRMLPIGKYESRSPPALAPALSDVVQGSSFELAVNKQRAEIQQHGLSKNLQSKLVELGIGLPDNLFPREPIGSSSNMAVAPMNGEPLRDEERHSLIDTGAQDAFEAETRTLNTAEREAVVKVRFGQGDFRNALLKEGGERCWMTGIEGKRLLIASHIKPWSHCQNDTDARGCQDNGLLLSALWDAAFDSGLISFESDWSVVVCSELSESAKTALGLMERMTLPEKYRTDTRKMYLAYHRAKVFEFWKQIEPIVGNPV